MWLTILVGYFGGQWFFLVLECVMSENMSSVWNGTYRHLWDVEVMFINWLHISRDLALVRLMHYAENYIELHNYAENMFCYWSHISMGKHYITPLSITWFPNFTPLPNNLISYHMPGNGMAALSLKCYTMLVLPYGVPTWLKVVHTL